MLQSVLRNFIAYGTAHIADRCITFFFMVYAARVLGPDRFGLYLLIGTYVLFFSITFTAGVIPVAVREIVRQRDDPQSVLECVLSLRLVLGLLAYAMLAIFIGFVRPTPGLLPLALIAGTTLILDAFRDTFAAYHAAFERMSVPSTFQVASSLLTAACGAVLLYLDYGVLALFAASALVNLVTTFGWHVFFSRHFRRYRIGLAAPGLKRMLLLVAPMAPLYLAVQFNQLASVMMLSFVNGPIPRARAVGYFGPAQQIANFPLGLLFGLRRVMVPPVADRLRRGARVDKEFVVSLKMAIVFLSFPMVVVTSVFASEILVLMFGPGYVEATLSLRLLGGAAALWIAAIFPETFLICYPEEKMTRFLPGAYTPLMVNLGLCLVLIPAYGIAGAAFAILASRGLHLIFAIQYCRAVLPLDSVRFAGFIRPVAWLCAAYAGCLLSAYSIETVVLRAIAILTLSVAGMLLAGRAELAELWCTHLRRVRLESLRSRHWQK